MFRCFHHDYVLRLSPRCGALNRRRDLRSALHFRQTADVQDTAPFTMRKEPVQRMVLKSAPNGTFHHAQRARTHLSKWCESKFICFHPYIIKYILFYILFQENQELFSKRTVPDALLYSCVLYGRIRKMSDDP